MPTECTTRSVGADLPGPGLASRLDDCDAAALSEFDLVEMMCGAQRLVSWAMAHQLAAMAELDRRRMAQARARGGSTQVAGEMVVCEIASALAVTDAMAAIRAAVAWKLDGPLTATRAALTAGRIDFDKARAICDAITGLRPEVAALVEASALHKAERLTVAQLRPLLRKLIAEADPQEAEERKAKAVAGRRVEVWPTGEGTMDLCGRDLPETDAHAAYNRINAIAIARRTDGDPRPIDQIRADVFTDLLRTHLPTPIERPDPNQSETATFPQNTPHQDGAPATTTSALTQRPHHPGNAATPPQAPEPASAARATSHPSTHPLNGDRTADPKPWRMAANPHIDGEVEPCTSRLRANPLNGDGTAGPIPGQEGADRDTTGGGQNAPLTGQRELAAKARQLAVRERHLAVKEAEFAVQAEKAAELERKLAAAVAGHVRHALTDLLQTSSTTGLTSGVTPAAGAQAAGRHRLMAAEAGRRIFTALAELKTAWCQTSTNAHGEQVHGRAGYRPSTAQRARLTARDTRCMWPGCRRLAKHCDADHSVPYHRHGPTCTCNLQLLCRRHHRLKTQPGWTLIHPWPGVVLWISPTGHWRLAGPNTDR